MSRAQWDAYQQYFKEQITSYAAGTGTYRAVQPVNGRTIYLQYGYITGKSYINSILSLSLIIVIVLLSTN